MKGKPLLLVPVLLLAAAAARAETLPAQQAREQGVKRCGALVGKIADFLLKEAKHGSDAT